MRLTRYLDISLRVDTSTAFDDTISFFSLTSFLPSRLGPYLCTSWARSSRCNKPTLPLTSINDITKRSTSASAGSIASYQLPAVEPATTHHVGPLFRNRPRRPAADCRADIDAITNVLSLCPTSDKTLFSYRCLPPPQYLSPVQHCCRHLPCHCE